MLKLMIVDDEYIVRQGMRKIVPWGEIGIHIAGEAENVQEAVEIARRVLPDIVICDIRLPGGTGFHAVEAIREIVPWVQFIMLTAHSDREFMLQAIHKGACDYLFKPARVEDIKSAVARASEKVLEYQEKMLRDMKNRNFVMENLDVLRENFLENLLKGELGREKALQDAQALKVCLKGPGWRILSLDLREQDYYEMIQQISSRLEIYGPEISCPAGHRNRMFVLLNLSRDAEVEQIQKEIAEMPVEKVFLSEWRGSLEEIPQIYQSCISGEEPEGWEPGELLLKKREMLFDAVKYHDSAEELRRLFLEFLEEIRNSEASDQQIRHECRKVFDTVQILTGVSAKKGEKEQDSSEMEEQFAYLCREIQESKRYQLDDVSGKALYYIRKKCETDLTLEQVAAELFMSSSYLSRIIKERTGHGFGHWLNFYRIQNAREKLRDTSKSIEQVAQECGYNSYRIFSENFRKYTGMTASSWRAEQTK